MGSKDSKAEKVGGAAGGVGGAVGGAAIGSVAGPIGTVIGGIAGAVGGWWAGKEVADVATGFDADEDYYKESFKSSSSKSPKSEYKSARPAYQLGYVASQNPDYKGRKFESTESELKSGWTKDMGTQHGKWDDVREYAAEGFKRGEKNATDPDKARRVTRSEEELKIGKRDVEAGEVRVTKSVDTEHKTEKVPVMREEVTIERRPVEAGRSSGQVEIGEDEIRVPVMKEQAVVEKKVVAKEEITLTKNKVQDTETVEADLKKERVDVDDQTRRTAASSKKKPIGENRERA